MMAAPRLTVTSSMLSTTASSCSLSKERKSRLLPTVSLMRALVASSLGTTLMAEVSIFALGSMLSDETYPRRPACLAPPA